MTALDETAIDLYAPPVSSAVAAFHSIPPSLPSTDVLETLMVLLEMHDVFTRLHSERVAVLSMYFGIDYGFSSEELHKLNLAARFHDIGKLGVPDSLLLKPSHLDLSEWQTMKTHPELGSLIFSATGHPHATSIAAGILHHHEHFDGSGYPHGLVGTDIPLVSRILQLIDNYDALGERRPYHSAKEHGEIMQMLEMKGGIKHDPEILEIFARVIGKESVRRHYQHLVAHHHALHPRQRTAKRAHASS